MFRRYLAAAAIACGAALAASGCGPLLTASAGSGDPNSEASITLTASENAQAVPVNEPVVLQAQQGRLTSVAVNGSAGPLPGTISEDGTTWTSEPGLDLPFAAGYEVVATAVDAEGRPAELVDTFSTVNPTYTTIPGTRYVTDNDVYGVGMPLTVVLGTSVTDRADIENRLNLVTSVPVTGAWSWSEDNSVVTFRPQEPWPAGTKVDLIADLYGVKLNDETYASADLTLDYAIGDAVVMNVDVPSLTMSVTRNGTPVMTIPVTIGKPGFETHDGIKVISNKEGTITMRSAPGSSEPYVVDNVEYSMRLTDHGEYLHAAPWAADSFGVYPNSHGCISMTTANARSLWGIANEGDIVTVFGTGMPSRLGNGISVWNESWEQWLSKSATGAHTYGPQGLVAETPAAAAPAA